MGCNTTNSVKTMVCGIAMSYVKTMVCSVTMAYVKTMVCSVAINFLKITLILQPACSDVEIGPARALGNRLLETLMESAHCTFM